MVAATIESPIERRSYEAAWPIPEACCRVCLRGEPEDLLAAMQSMPFPEWGVTAGALHEKIRKQVPYEQFFVR